jgi:hypothetical protein
VWAVGLRQKALRQRFLIATTAYSCFPQPVDIRDHPRYPRENIRVNSRLPSVALAKEGSSAVKTGSGPELN